MPQDARETLLSSSLCFRTGPNGYIPICAPDKHPSFSEDTGKRLILQISLSNPAHLHDLFDFSSVTLSTNTGAPCHSPSPLCSEKIRVDVSQGLWSVQLSHAVTPTPNVPWPCGLLLLLFLSSSEASKPSFSPYPVFTHLPPSLGVMACCFHISPVN